MSARPVEGVNRTVELYVRSLAPASSHSCQESVLERLEWLASRGHVADFEVHVWGSRFDPSGASARTVAGRFVRERLATFTEWADRNGLSIRTFFDERPVRSSVTGEDYTAVVLPTMTLAEYVDGELEFVAPCSDGETVHTVEDRLAELTPEEPTPTADSVAKGGTS